MSRIEKEEKKTHVDWIAPINLQRIAWNLGYFFQLQTSIPNHVLAESPIVGEDVDKGERHAKRAEKDVGHRQRSDEHVSCCQHHLMVIMKILVIMMTILVFHNIRKASVFQFWKLCKKVF